MFKKSALIVSTALVLALPAGAALASTNEVDDQTIPTVTCDRFQEGAQFRQSAGNPDCVYGEDGARVNTMTQERHQYRDQAECTGAGRDARDGSAGNGHGPGDGSGPREQGPPDGSGNRFGRTGR